MAHFAGTWFRRGCGSVITQGYKWVRGLSNAQEKRWGFGFFGSVVA